MTAEQVKATTALYEYLTEPEPQIFYSEEGHACEPETPQQLWRAAAGMVRMEDKGICPNMPHPEDPRDSFTIAADDWADEYGF